MIQRDYFIRLIQEFMAAVTRFLEKKEGEDKKDLEMKDLYRQYVGIYDVIRNLSFEELLTYAQEQWEEKQRIQRLEMVAELYYAEACYKGEPLHAILLDKAWKVFDYVNTHGADYSIDRMQKMLRIHTELDKR